MKICQLPILAAALCLAFPVFAERTSKVLPFDQLGAEAGNNYKGDGLAITPTEHGANLRCDFQNLRGKVTREGLRLESAGQEASDIPFRVVAQGFGRGNLLLLPTVGEVESKSSLVLFVRPGVVEEYSVSVNGVRQDFLVGEKPGGTGPLRLTLAVDGARAESAPGGASLILDGSDRKIAYQSLLVTDATGQTLAAHIEVNTANSLAVVVDDTSAIYPIRVDPTFSDADWVSLNPSIPGANDWVFAAVLDGIGNLYVGGQFSVAGNVIANNIAKWDGSNWTSLGSGLLGGTPKVEALAISGSDLYVGGSFSTAGGVVANGIAKWDGTSWSALGSGVNSVNALAVSGADLYVGGTFTTAGGVTANNIAKWDGSAWSPLGSGVSGATPLVSALAVSGADLYVGGFFTSAGGLAANRIAKWNGSAWSSLGGGMNNGVYTLVTNGADLYAGGGFSAAGGVANTSYIAKWNGSNWLALGTGVNSPVNELAVSGSDLYAGGSFSIAGGVANTKYIAKWNGSAWSSVGSGINGTVYAIAAGGADFYAGGQFTAAGGVTAQNVAKWSGGAWSALGFSGLNSVVYAVVASGTDLYVGGGFTTAGGVVTNCIAKWDGSTWSALGVGMNGTVQALAMSGSDLYAGGFFTTAGGVPANRVAKWNGSNWSALGAGISSAVNVLAASGTDLYVGGEFDSAGGIANTNYISKWNGSSWSALGSGMNSSVKALAMMGTNLYAGGNFTTAGGVTANRVARWNGSSWSSLGSGMNGSEVRALLSSGTDLIAGGDFTTSGGVNANRIAKWNGSAWSALGSGMSGTVSALAVNGTDLYAGGFFTLAGGTPANRIAKWNGTTWSALGTGVSGAGIGGQQPTVNALTLVGTSLYAGGTFALAGDTVSPYIAQANLAPLFPNIAVTQTTPLTDGVSDIGFGTVNAGSNSTAKLFTITNTGEADLSGLVLTKDGPNAADFTVSALTGTNIPTGPGTVTFTVIFSPAAGASTRSATIHIASNVTGTLNPFDITLTGTANNPPTDMTLSATNVLENVPAGTIVGTISSTDPDSGDTFTYSLVGGNGSTDNGAFSITGAMLRINNPPVFATQSSYAIRIRSTDPADLLFEKSFTITITQVIKFSNWTASAGLIGADASLTAMPFDDGVENLLKYAFNMNAAGPDVSVLGTGGISGLPQIAVDSSGAEPVLRVQFLRRKDSGLIYTPQRSDLLGSFAAMTGMQTVTSIDAQWERVSVEETAPPTGAPSAFARVQVTLP